MSKCHICDYATKSKVGLKSHKAKKRKILIDKDTRTVRNYDKTNSHLCTCMLPSKVLLEITFQCQLYFSFRTFFSSLEKWIEIDK